jgi:hypothetical protein
VAWIALGWGALWLAIWLAICGTIGVVDPDSLDPGDWEGLLVIMAPMGLVSGLVFALLATRAACGGAPSSLPPARAMGWGVLATALVQVLYLGHGDAGLLANLGQALLFSVGGGIVTLLWSLIARRFGSLRRPGTVSR